MHQRRERLTGPTLHRASVGVDVIDSAKRRIRLSFSSEAPVLRQSWFSDPWFEVLGHDPGEINLDRINGGAAPLLWGHDAYSRDAHIGIVERAWSEGGKGYADVMLSPRDDLASMWQDIEAGVIRNVSVGYQIHERALVSTSDTGPATYRVTSWTPMEISLVSVPADPDVGVGRSADAPGVFTVSAIEDERAMGDETKPGTPEPVVVDVQAERAAAVAAERARVREIGECVRAAGLGDDVAQRYIETGADIAEVRKSVIEELGKRRAPAAPHISAGADQIDKTRDAGEAWLMQRAGMSVDAGALNGNAFRGFTLLETARAMLRARGKGFDGSKLELVQRALTQSDFPILLQNVMHKTLLAGYTAIPDVWRTFCAVGNINDFRPHYRYKAGSFGNLAEVKEDGTFTHGVLSDGSRESITGKTKGKLLSISRQAIINDDLGALTSAAREMGRGAARTIEVDVFALLASNPTMGDSVALFHASHSNLNASGGAPTIALIDGGRQAMAAQLNVGGNDYISVRPSVWLGPLTHGSTARELNAQQYNDESSKNQLKPNIVRGLFQTVVDTPRLSGNIWYMFADPNEEPVLEVAFLDGQQQPYVEMQDGFETDGVTWKIRHDYAVGAVGYRGAYKVTW